MGHHQTPTIISTDNSTTHGFCHKNIQLKKSKSWDMNLHWLREKETTKQISIKLNKGKDNTADYYTKTSHTTLHHRQQQPLYIKDKIHSAFCEIKLMFKI